jgi:hypothetical protein
MAVTQTVFLEAFKAAFAARFGQEQLVWGGGQGAGNIGALPGRAELRRAGKLMAREAFELGDLRIAFRGADLLVEFDQGAVDLRNVLKYWPFIRGELTATPTRPVMLCHFSRWHSYGSFRDLWHWTVNRMQQDERVIVPFIAQHFDHWIEDPAARAASIEAALDWVDTTTNKPLSQNPPK